MAISSRKVIDYDFSTVKDMDKEYLLNELMEKHMDKVYLLAYSFVKDHGKAEDISQEVFIKCYKKIDMYRGDAAISSWIYRITVNTAKDLLKRRKLARLKYPLEFFGREQHTESTENTYIKQDQKEQVLMAVLDLSVKYREVLILYYFHDQTVEEISETLNDNVNTVKTRLSRGRDKLKKNIRFLEGG